MSRAKRIPAREGNRIRQALREARLGRGMSHAELAERAGVPEREVWAAERGERPEGLAAIAFVLGLGIGGKGWRG